MATVLTDDANYTAIANAIRAKGGEGTFTPAQMATAIANLPSGGAGNKVLTSAIITGTASKIDISNYTTDDNFILILGMKENSVYNNWIVTPSSFSWSVRDNYGVTTTDHAGILLANSPSARQLTTPSSGITKFYHNGVDTGKGYFAFGTYFSRIVTYSNGIFTQTDSRYPFATSSILFYLAEATT